MTDYKKYINALRKCAKEHDNDRTFTGHIIISDLCRDIANLLETLEQEHVLDKIRAEIERLHHHPKLDFIKNDDVVEMALEVIDKYR